MNRKFIIIPIFIIVVSFFIFKIDGESRPKRKLIIISNYIKYLMTLPLSEEQFHLYQSETARLIAHAGGAVKGQSYLDTLEALDTNYAKGARFFELDLRFTRDRKVVAVHSWKEWAKRVHFIGSLPPMHLEFMQTTITGHTPLDSDLITKWFIQHADATLVTDKLDDPLAITALFPFYRDRIMMEIFSWEHFDLARRLGVYAPMINGDLLLHDFYLRDLKEHHVQYAAMSRRQLPTYLDRVEKMGERGIRVYLYHAQEDGFTDRTTFQRYIPAAYGIYFDIWEMP